MSARTARAALATLAAVFLIAADTPETRLEQYQRLRREGAAAAQAGDLATAETRLEAALALYPHIPGSLIRLARVEIAAGKPNEAVVHVAAYAQLGLTLDPVRDPALKTLIDRADFAPVAERLKANAEPVGEPKALMDLGPASDVLEGVLRVEGGWMLSSVAGHTLTWMRKDGTPRTFLLPEADPSGLFGMAYDPRRKIVWVAEARGPGIPGSTGKARTGLVKVSWPRGDVLARFFVPEDGDRHQLGDVVIGEDGTIYASDAVGGVIYRLKPGGARLEPFVAAGQLASPQGMAICPGGALVVADYSTGLHRIDPATGTVTPVGGLHVALAGADGLFRIEHDFGMRNARPLPVALVATQNGVSPARVLFLRLSPDCREIEDLKVLAAGHPGMDDMTLGAFGDGAIVFVGGAGWAGYDGDGKPTTSQPGWARLYRLPLPNGE